MGTAPRPAGGQIHIKGHVTDLIGDRPLHWDGSVEASDLGGDVSDGERRKLQRITEPIWWYRHTGCHSAEACRLGKQTLCQLSYSRSGGWAEARAARIYHHSPAMGEPGVPKGEPPKSIRSALVAGRFSTGPK